VAIPGRNPGLNKSRTEVRFGVAAACNVVMDITDMEGRIVKTLAVDDVMAGTQSWALTLDEDGVPLNGTGLYRYELVASDSTGVLFRDAKIMTQYDSIDFDQQPVLGVTDSQGRISYADKTRFPFLYELGPQPGRDERGEPTGEFDFSETVVFTLVDTATNEHRNVEALVNSGLNIITLVWDEPLLVKANEPESGSRVEKLSREKSAPPFEWYLDQNIPNPFN
jgi:hypothetical protein